MKSFRLEIVSRRGKHAEEARDLLRGLELLVGANRFAKTHLEALANGERFYNAELAAIRTAQRSIRWEAYIFHKHRVGRIMLEALTDRARAGVDVRVLADAVGNWHVPHSFFRPLLDAGGKVHFFRPIPRLPWLNQRTHREIVVVDNETAFIGGAGVADRWMYGEDGEPRWRDNMFRVQGDAVPMIAAMFARAWYERTSELEMFTEPPRPWDGPDCCGGLVMGNRPRSASSSPSHLVLQALWSQAEQSVNITSPYFGLPGGLLNTLCAAGKRGVSVRILTPGDNSDHLLTRALARNSYAALLEAGAEIYEYRPSMIHAKTMTIDGQISIVGSLNMDQRSIGRNEEVILIADDQRFASELVHAFERDLRVSRRISEDWRRPLFDRMMGAPAWLLQREL